MPNRVQRTLLIVLVSIFCLPVLFAQVLSSRKIGDKQITCMDSGITSELEDCGPRSYSYSYVFVGAISAVTPAADDEMKLRIVTQEVFFGKPDRVVTVLTSQGLCFTKFAVGDQWLFYMRKEDGKPIVLDYYGNPSAPVAESKPEIETLRRLEKIGNFAILRGQVIRGKRYRAKPVRNARVVAWRAGAEPIVVTTNSNGRYEFKPLPPGKYVIKTQAKGLHRPSGDWAIDLRPGECLDLNPDRLPLALSR